MGAEYKVQGTLNLRYTPEVRDLVEQFRKILDDDSVQIEAHDMRDSGGEDYVYYFGNEDQRRALRIYSARNQLKSATAVLQEAEPRDPRRADTKQTYNLVLGGAEIDTVLAALRYWQHSVLPAEKLAVMGLAGHFEANQPLTTEQIDALCEYINQDA